MRYDLYIDGALCDLDEQSLIVLTYTEEQLTNPTAVKNTYSHEVELPQTPSNDKIFNHYYRNDYQGGVGSFSPLSQLPFVIYNELGEIAEQGYIKLDEVTIDNTTHRYKVVLYGGLGSFFYSLAYDGDGNALRLADLQYMTNAADEGLLNYFATAFWVKTAWNNIDSIDDDLARYRVLNFAPTYSGTPEGDFDANKAIYYARRYANNADNLLMPIHGIPDTIDGLYDTQRSFVDGVSRLYATLVDLKNDYTEWEAKDLRAYIQRPILSMKAFVEAVQRRATAYGYTLDLDDTFFNDNNPYYAKAWMTLPSLQSLSKNSVEVSISLNAAPIIGSAQSQTIEITSEMPDLSDFTYGGTVSNTRIEVRDLNVTLDDLVRGSGRQDIAYIYRLTAEWSADLYSIYAEEYVYIYTTTKKVWMVQLYGEDENGNVVTASDVAMLVDEDNTDSVGAISGRARAQGYAPKGSNINYGKINSIFALGNAANYRVYWNKIFEIKKEEQMTLPTRWYLKVDKYVYLSASTDYSEYRDSENVEERVERDNRIDTLYGYGIGWRGYSTTFADGEVTNVSGSAEVNSNTTIRSGAIINKETLFDIGKTPLEVLLSYTKMFGLRWLYESDNNTIHLMRRDTFYDGGTTIDLHDRIDRAKAMTIKPFEFDKKFYDFELETEGAWAEEYADKYGRVYGSQRVDTGYNFDAESKNLLEGSALRGAVEALEMSKYYNNITEGTYELVGQTYPKIAPSVFLDGGTYQKYESGDTTDVDVTLPSNEAEIEYYQQGLQGYDYAPKVQLHDNGGGAVDGVGVLLLYDGKFNTEGTPYANYRLSDDTPEMSILNEGVPCWILEGSRATSSDTYFNMPKFVRASGVSMDMGVPRELDTPIPDTESVENSIYSQYWARYLADRYDVNSRVVSCYVDLRGMQVNKSLFRNFYYFDGAMWVLNKINNYSLTTIGSTECEFVKVQNLDNYKEL